MKKPDSLRAFLANVLTEALRQPDALDLHVEGGTIAARHGVNLGFEYRYKLVISAFDFRGDAVQLFLPLLLWLRVNQPEILLNHDDGVKAITFEADIMSNDAQDIIITLPLTEAVDVLPRADGSGYDFTVRDEPPIADTEAFEDVDPVALLKQIWRDGVLICGYPDLP
jgi:hypothetical protein